VLDPVEETILALSLSKFGGVTGDIKFAGEGSFECNEGGVGSWRTLVGVGYKSTNDLRDGFSGGIEEVVAVIMLLVLGFGCVKGPEEGAGRVSERGRDPDL